ncbi:unnamed protein product [Closterium sp. NIES-54]
MAAAKRVLRYLCSTSGLGLVLGGRSLVVLTGHADASWVDDLAMQRSSQGYTFSLGSGSVSFRSTRSSSVLTGAEIYAGAMAAQELRWLTYLLTDLGETPRSPPVLYVDNKAMLALCREHRLEHRTKHIGIHQTFTLPASPQQNGIAERRIGMVMDVARTSMIHAAAPHFLWPFTVQYAAHQINLQPRVSLPETSPTLRWTGQVGDASAFRVWGSRAFVRDLSADKLSSRAVPCVFLGFPPDPGWQFYHPTSRRVLSSQDVTFDESGPAPSGVSQVDAVEPDEVAADSGASRGAEPGCAESGGAEPGGAWSERAEPGGAASWGAEPGATESGGVEPVGTGPSGNSGALSWRELPSPQELREWFARRWSRAAGSGGAASAGGSAATGGTGAGGAARAGTGGSTSTGGAGDSGPEGARTGGTGAAGPAGAPGARAGGAAGVGATGGTGAGASVSAGVPAGAGAAGGTGTGGAPGVGADAGGAGVVPAGSGGAARPRPYFVPLLEQLASPLSTPSPYAGPTGGLAERREPESRPASPVRTARTSRRVPRPRPPAVPGTHQMALRPSTTSQRVSLPSPPASSLPALADPASDSLRAASPTVTRLLATVVTDPSFESTAASALVTELVYFAAH